MTDNEQAQVTGEGKPEEEGLEDEPTAKAGDSKSTPAPKQPANEIKVVIVMKADKILLGVQAPDCDPVYTTMKGDLSKALKRVPGLVTEAKQKWEATPRYPKANLPEPAPSPTQARSSVVAKSTKPKAQPAMF